jgi:hypothetical protein
LENRQFSKGGGVRGEEERRGRRRKGRKRKNVMMTLDRREASFVLHPVEQPSKTMNLFFSLLFFAIKKIQEFHFLL